MPLAVGVWVFTRIQVERRSHQLWNQTATRDSSTSIPPWVFLNPTFHPDCTFRKSPLKFWWLKLCLLVLHSFLIGIPFLLLYGKLYPDLKPASSLAFSSLFFLPAPNLIIYFHSNLQWLLLTSDESLNSLTWPNYCHSCLSHISHLPLSPNPNHASSHVKLSSSYSFYCHITRYCNHSFIQQKWTRCQLYARQCCVHQRDTYRQNKFLF